MLINTKYKFFEYNENDEFITNLPGYSFIDTIYKVVNGNNYEAWNYKNNSAFNFDKLENGVGYLIISKDSSPNYTLYESSNTTYEWGTPPALDPYDWGTPPKIETASYVFGPAPTMAPASFSFGPAPTMAPTSFDWGTPPKIEVQYVDSNALTQTSLETYLNGNLATHLIPSVNSTYDLGSAEYKIRHLYLSNNSLYLGDAHVRSQGEKVIVSEIQSGDIHLTNVEKDNGNSIDGTRGHYTIQEGADDLFLINNITGKKYKFNLTEII